MITHSMALEMRDIKRFPHPPTFAANDSLIEGVHAGVSHQWSCPNLAIAASLFLPSTPLANIEAAMAAIR